MDGALGGEGGSIPMELMSYAAALDDQQLLSVIARLAPLPGPSLQTAVLRLLPPAHVI